MLEHKIAQLEERLAQRARDRHQRRRHERRLDRLGRAPARRRRQGDRRVPHRRLGRGEPGRAEALERVARRHARSSAARRARPSRWRPRAAARSSSRSWRSRPPDAPPSALGATCRPAEPASGRPGGSRRCGHSALRVCTLVLSPPAAHPQRHVGAPSGSATGRRTSEHAPRLRRSASPTGTRSPRSARSASRSRPGTTPARHGGSPAARWRGADMGKLVFLDVVDRSGRIQVICDASRTGELDVLPRRRRRRHGAARRARAAASRRSSPTRSRCSRATRSRCPTRSTGSPTSSCGTASATSTC